MRTDPAPAASECLLALDSDLGRNLEPERFAEASAALVVRTEEIASGRWEPPGADGESSPVAVLVTSGLISKEVQVPGGRASELLGAGDIIRAAEIADEQSLMPTGVAWSVLEPATVCLLDETVDGQLDAFPEVAAALRDRDVERIVRLGLLRGAAHVGRVEDRLLVLMWLLAARHGRVGREGVILPLKLRHRLLGDLVGASRSTVTLALGSLERREAITRRLDGGWILIERPDATLERSTRRAVSHRARETRTDSSGAVDIATLHARVADLSETYHDQREASSALHKRAQEIRDRSAQLRDAIGRDSA